MLSRAATTASGGNAPTAILLARNDVPHIATNASSNSQWESGRGALTGAAFQVQSARRMIGAPSE